MMISNEEKIKDDFLAKNRVYCKSCGHVMYIVKQEKALCDWCGHYIFKDKRAEFKYRLKEQLIRSKRKNQDEKASK